MIYVEPTRSNLKKNFFTNVKWGLLIERKVDRERDTRRGRGEREIGRQTERKMIRQRVAELNL